MKFNLINFLSNIYGIGKIAKNHRKNSILFHNKLFHNDSDICTEWCERPVMKKFHWSCAWQGFLPCTSSARGKRALSFQPDRFYREKNHLGSPGNLVWFEFCVSLAARSTLKNIRAVGLEASGNQSCAIRVCKPICQFHGATAPKNGVGKIVWALFSPKVVWFPVDHDVLGYSSFFSRHEFRSLYHWACIIRKIEFLLLY